MVRSSFAEWGLVFVRVDYNVEGRLSQPVKLEKFELGAETEDSRAKDHPEWIRNGVFWKRKSD
jgi:hypothetical protein